MGGRVGIGTWAHLLLPSPATPLAQNQESTTIYSAQAEGELPLARHTSHVAPTVVSCVPAWKAASELRGLGWDQIQCTPRVADASC